MPAKRTSAKLKGTRAAKRTSPRSRTTPSEATQRRAWREEVNYFERIRSRLHGDPAYRDKYVAILGHKIVGVDDDRFALFQRMSATYPRKVVLLEQATREPRRVELPSVEICR